MLPLVSGPIVLITILMAKHCTKKSESEKFTWAVFRRQNFMNVYKNSKAFSDNFNVLKILENVGNIYLGGIIQQWVTPQRAKFLSFSISVLVSYHYVKPYLVTGKTAIQYLMERSGTFKLHKQHKSTIRSQKAVLLYSFQWKIITQSHVFTVTNLHEKSLT